MTGSETGRPEMISDETVERAQAAWLAAKQARDGQPTRMRAALAAVADELAERGARAERERIAAALDETADIAASSAANRGNAAIWHTAALQVRADRTEESS